MNHFTFPYTIKTSRRASNIRISIKPSGEVVVSKPWLIPDLIALQFLKSHTKWVEEKLVTLKSKSSDIKSYLYKGILYDIVYKTNKFSYNFTNNNLLLSGFDLESALRNLEKLHILEGSKLIKKIVPTIAVSMGVHYGKISIKDQNSRWGSCSSRGNLNFSWRLIKAPIKVLEYVIIHELAHIKHMDHSSEFWKLVEQYDPMYREHRRWLRRNQSLMK